MPTEYQLKHKQDIRPIPHTICNDTGLVHNAQMTESVLYG